MFWDCHIFKHIPQFKRIDITESFSITNEAYISSLPSSLPWSFGNLSLSPSFLTTSFNSFHGFSGSASMRFRLFWCSLASDHTVNTGWLPPFQFNMEFAHKQFVTCSKVGPMTHLCFCNYALSPFLRDEGGQRRLREPLNSTSKEILNSCILNNNP